MRTIDTTATIHPDGTIVARGPVGLPTGEHEVRILLKEAVMDRLPSRPPLRLSAYPLAPASPTMTFRREDIYDDDGR
jgi:hypothetical protein